MDVVYSTNIQYDESNNLLGYTIDPVIINDGMGKPSDDHDSELLLLVNGRNNGSGIHPMWFFR